MAKKGKGNDKARNPVTGRTVERAEKNTKMKANRISTLNRTMSEMQSETAQKTQKLQEEIKAINRQQREAAKQLGMADKELSGETMKEMNSLIDNMGKAMGSFASGISRITKDTAKASTDVVSQYGKAISEDINLNRQNTVAMALSSATPLFGYFAAKFMETDVFQGAAKRIKDRVGESVSQGLSGVGGLFKKREKVKETVSEETLRSELAALNAGVDEVKAEVGKSPKMQAGGYVRKGGIAEVHPAEVIMPIDKVLKEFTEARKPETDRLIKTIQTQAQKTRRETLKSLEANRKVLSELKVSIAGTVSQLRISFQRFLLEHPMIKGIMQFSELIQTVFASPLKFLFGIRGGYRGMANRAVSTNNVFLKSANMLQLMFGVWTPKIDHIVEILNEQLDFMSGRKVPQPKEKGTFTLFGKIQEFLTTRSIQTAGESVFDTIVESLNLDRAALKSIGISSIGDFLAPDLEKGGITKEMLAGKIREAPGGPKEGLAGTAAEFVAGERTIKEAVKAAMEETAEKGRDVLSSVKDIFRSFKEEIPKAQEGGFVKKAGLATVHAAEVIASSEIMEKIKDGIYKIAEFTRLQYYQGVKMLGVMKTKISEKMETVKDYTIDNYRKTVERLKTLKDSEKTQKAILKAQEIGNTWREQSVEISKKAVSASKATGKKLESVSKKWVRSVRNLGRKMARIGKRLMKSIGKLMWNMVIFLGNFLGNIMRIGWRILTPIASFIGSGAMRMLAAGPKGILKGMIAMGGAMTAGAAGLTMMGVDAARGFGRAKEWETSRTAAVLGGAVGGVGEAGTAKATAWGAGKGGLIGAAIGTVVAPGIGTAIGGGIGALAGGILGFIGGEKVAKAFDWLGDKLKRVVKAITKVVFFPIRLVWRIVKGLGKGFWRIGKAIFKINFKVFSTVVKIWWRLFKIPFKIIGRSISIIARLLGIDLSKADGAWIKWLEKALEIIFSPIIVLANIADKIDQWLTWVDEKTKNIDELIATHMENLFTLPFRFLADIANRMREWVRSKFGPILKLLGMEELFEPYGKEMKPKASPSFDKYTANTTYAKAAEGAMMTEATNRIGEQISSAVSEGMTKASSAIVQNTNVVSNNIANLANNIGGGGGANGDGNRGSFGTGNDHTSSVLSGMM